MLTSIEPQSSPTLNQSQSDVSPALKQLEELRATIEKLKKKKRREHSKAMLHAMRHLKHLEAQVENEKANKINEERLVEVTACIQSFKYFVDKYCFIYDGTQSTYVPFHLWPGQYEAAEAVERDRLLLLLKARQLGMTWLCLAYALWLMQFRSDVTILLFSLRDGEACELVSRLYEMWRRLPDWMRVPGTSNAHSMSLQNGSIAKAFPTTAGDSYNATLAIVDEADLVPDLDRMMGRVKPTIDAGGKLFLVSRVDKKHPESFFKKAYRAIKAGEMPDWKAVFLPWSARPERNQAWYEAQKKFSVSTTGTLDWVHEQYPATPEQALAPSSLDKRFPPDWLQACFKEKKPLNPIMFKPGSPAIPQMQVYAMPDPRRNYSLGADPAQGNPNSDDSSLVVLDDVTGEEVCTLSGKYEPAVFASMINKIALWYKAGCMIERNNHGHAVLMWLADHGKCRVLDGPDGDKGYYTTSKTKIDGYDKLAEDIRGRRIIVHNSTGYMQLSSIEAASLSAPDDQMDDRAMAWMLANYGRGKNVNYKLMPKPEIKPEHSTILANREKIFG